MAKEPKIAEVVRRSVRTTTLTRIDLGDGVVVWTNTAGAIVAMEYDKGDGVVRRVELTT
jgi:hypothetical protein